MSTDSLLVVGRWWSANSNTVLDCSGVKVWETKRIGLSNLSLWLIDDSYSLFEILHRVGSAASMKSFGDQNLWLIWLSPCRSAAVPRMIHRCLSAALSSQSSMLPSVHVTIIVASKADVDLRRGEFPKSSSWWVYSVGRAGNRYSYVLSAVRTSSTICSWEAVVAHIISKGYIFYCLGIPHEDCIVGFV